MGDERGRAAERELALGRREEDVRRAEERLERAREAHRRAIQAREQEAQQLRDARAELARHRAKVLEEIRQREDRLAVREETLELGLGTVEQAIRDGLAGEALADVVRVLRESVQPMPPAAEPEERRWNIDILAPLVRERAQADPERGYEWEAYLESLRPYADEAGFVPATFNGLIDGVFGEPFRAALVRAA